MEINKRKTLFLLKAENRAKNFFQNNAKPIFGFEGLLGFGHVIKDQPLWKVL